MPVRLILVFAFFAHTIFYCQVSVSKLYHTPPRSSTLGIYNLEPDHFYVTRYNRLAHDITIERRKKSDGSVAAFTALKLDSVNAAWFNYENLDHAFFMKDGNLYFVFSRVLNSKSELYMKRLDTLGKSSGFIQIASLSSDKNDDFLELSFSVTEEQQLLICKTKALGTNVHRQVDLYEPSTKTVIFAAKLPAENPSTGYSQNYLFDNTGALYYLLYHQSYDWHMTDVGPPDLGFSTLMSSSYTVNAVELVVINKENSTAQKRKIEARGLSAVHTAVPSITRRGYRLQLMYTGADVQGKEQIRFSIQDFDKETKNTTIIDQPLAEKLASTLTFFDGSDYDEAWRKTYSLEARIDTRESRYQFSERVQQNYYKELIAWQSDTSGHLITQVLIPRKILYYADRTRFRNLGKVMHATHRGLVYTFLLENPGNEKIPAAEFNFHEFKRQETVSGANLVAYVLRDGSCDKKIVYRNSDYSCVPVYYNGTMPDMVLYLVKNDIERFGIVQLNQL
jgi:hypothetical protein